MVRDRARVTAASRAAVRVAHAADASALAALRVALLEETGGPLAPDEREGLREANEVFLRETLGSFDEASEWSTWVIDGNDGVPVAMCSVVIWKRPPYPGNLAGLDAYLLNMFTLPSHRGQGMAHALLQAALSDTRRRGASKLVLHATEAGRAIYAPAGFEASGAYMELRL